MKEEKPTIIEAEDARGGSKSYQVVLVLLVSLVLAGLAMAILLGWFNTAGPAS